MKKILLFINMLLFTHVYAKMSEEQRYKYALLDAPSISPSELTQNLTVITPWNKQIRWKNGKIIVASYMNIEPAMMFYMPKDFVKNLLLRKDRNLWPAKYQSSRKITRTINGVPINLDLDAIQKSWMSLSEIEKNEKLNPTKQWWTSFSPAFPSMLQQNWILSWVTIAPELQSFAYQWTQTNSQSDLSALTTRLNEKLGLIPAKSQKVVVELLVDPKDLVRPSIDSEIFDTTSYAQQINNQPGQPQLYGLNTPLFDPYTQNNATSAQIKILQEKGKLKSYQAWFDKNQKESYTGQWAMPWTQLGYTYDYSQEAFDKDNHFGFSEFWIKPGSQVEISGIYSLDAYIQEYPLVIPKMAQNIIQAFTEAHNKFNSNQADQAILIQQYQNMLYYKEQLEVFDHKHQHVINLQSHIQQFKQILRESKETLESSTFMEGSTKRYIKPKHSYTHHRTFTPKWHAQDEETITWHQESWSRPAHDRQERWDSASQGIYISPASAHSPPSSASTVAAAFSPASPEQKLKQSYDSQEDQFDMPI